MLTSLVVIAAAVGALIGDVEARSVRKQPRQASYAKYINGTSTNVGNVELEISTQGCCRNATSPLLYGWMFEDINVSPGRRLFEHREAHADVAFRGWRTLR